MKEIGSSSGLNGESSITVSGSADELNRIRAMMNGSIWMSFKNGNIQTQDIFKTPPDPENDPLIPPQFQTEFGSLPAKFAPDLEDAIPKELRGGWTSPSFYISHIFNPPQSIIRLQSWGFECMRSRRGDDGKFWEVWYLPGFWASKGDLKKCIDSIHHDVAWENKTDQICHWIAQRIVFGSLDIAVQRMALCNPD